jgi:adenylate cyclase
VDHQGVPIQFQDKIVLIGATSIDLQDYYLSPLSREIRMPGVEIHANNIQTLISEQFLRDQSRESLWLILFLVIAVNLFLFSRLRVRFAIPIFLAELFAFVVAGIMTYEYRIFLNVIYPLLALLLTFVGAYLLRFILEQAERKFTEGAFGHYVDKSVVDQILKDPKMLKLGGVKKEVTAYFSDIAGYTSISEKMEPGQLVDYLNRYLDEMTNEILGNKGTLSKYEGDAIMAFWGAPAPLKDHAKSACLTALENQKKLAELRVEWEKKGLPTIHARIGINTGEVIAGNMGSKNRFDYTIMGDNVNLASRLESINKQYGTELMISENTYEIVKEDFMCRELDHIRVKGKEEPVRIYELINTKEKASADAQKKAEAFAQALGLYLQKNFEEATKKFAEIENDPPSAMFVKRCDEFIQTPPPANWDGVYTFTGK